MYCKYDRIEEIKENSIVFNRNILYCKFTQSYNLNDSMFDLIGTFCIVNEYSTNNSHYIEIDLIGTFCIVNPCPIITHTSLLIFNRNILYCKSQIIYIIFFQIL